MTILADFAAPPPTALSGFLESAAACVMLAYFTLCLIAKLKPEKAHAAELIGQPIRVSPATEYATTAELQKLEKRVDQLAAKIDDSFRALDHKRSSSIAGIHSHLESQVSQLRSEAKADAVGLHNRINDVLSAVSKLEGRADKTRP